jgi:hypothetical protein
MLREDVYPLASVIEEAFAASDVLALEADVFAAPQEELVQSIMAYAAYPPGQTCGWGMAKPRKTVRGDAWTGLPGSARGVREVRAAPMRKSAAFMEVAWSVG